MQLLIARPLVRAVKVAAQQPEEESERLRSRGSILESSRHLAKTIFHQGSEWGGRRLVRRDGTLEISPEGVLLCGDPRG